ncbi:MAG: hydroxyacid dehydrogenase, partial [Microbacterium sp.]|nr:hydroxyacid dehydrogenase [Microbacterium sp.]
MSPDTPALVVSVPDEQLARDLPPLSDGIDVVVWPMDGPPPRERIDIVVPPYMSSFDVRAQLEQVQTRLVHGQSIGYEGVADRLPPGIVFANAASVHETSTAELALALTLAAQR